MKVAIGLLLTVLTLAIFIYALTRAEIRRRREERQKHLALSCQRHASRQYARNYGMVDVTTKRRSN